MIRLGSLSVAAAMMAAALLMVTITLTHRRRQASTPSTSISRQTFSLRMNDVDEAQPPTQHESTSSDLHDPDLDDLDLDFHLDFKQQRTFPVDICPDDGILHLPRTAETEEYWEDYHRMLRLKEVSKVKYLPTYRGVISNPFYVVYDAYTEDVDRKHTARVRFRSAWNDVREVVDEPDRWIAPLDIVREGSSSFGGVIELDGDYVSFINIFSGNYAHFLYDHLPQIAHLRDTLPENVKILLLDVGGKDRRTMELIDPEFEASRIQWITQGTVYKIRGNLLYSDVLKSYTQRRFPALARKVRNWIHEKLPGHPAAAQKTVVYYSRSGAKNVHHGRTVDAQHQQHILDLIQHTLERHGRSERLVVFNGYEDDGETPMTAESQVDLFRSATTIIGPHGSGVANFVWMDPPLRVSDCHQDRFKILEFLVTRDLEEVQDGGAARTFYMQYSFPSWIEYHHIFYANNSTSDRTFVDLNHLGEALDAMFR